MKWRFLNTACDLAIALTVGIAVGVIVFVLVIFGYVILGGSP